MDNYVNYRDKGETEERIQITKATCDNEEDIYEAIEKSKRDLKETEVPSGYQKLDEQIITTVYKIPGSRKPHRRYYSNFEKNISNRNNTSYYLNKNPFKTYNTGKKKYFYEQYECQPKYNNKFDNYSEYRIKNDTYKTISSPFKNSNNYDDQNCTIYNYNTITRNHGYHETKSPSPRKKNTYRTQYQTSQTYKTNRYNTDKINRNFYNYKYNTIDINNRTYNENENEYESNHKKYRNYTNFNGGRIENYFENTISQDGKYLVSMTLSKRIQDEEDEEPKYRGGKDYGRWGNKYRNDYYREEMEYNEEREPREYEESRRTINKRVRDYGDNYKYFERNENRSPQRVTETKQRRRGPVHVYGNEYYETNEEINRYKDYYPIRTEKKITRYYTNENFDEEGKY